MKRSKGSLSIFLILIIPFITLGLITIYYQLSETHFENKMIKTALHISNIQMDLSNEHLFENYGILAYTNQSLIHDMLAYAYGPTVQSQQKHMSLSDPSEYIKGIEMAGYTLAGNIAIEKIYEIVQQSYDLSAAKELIKTINDAEAALQIINEFSEMKKVYSKMLKNGVSHEWVLEAMTLVTQKMNQNSNAYNRFKDEISLNDTNAVKAVMALLDRTFDKTNDHLNEILLKSNIIMEICDEIVLKKQALKKLGDELNVQGEPDTEEIKAIKSEIQQLNHSAQEHIKMILAKITGDPPNILSRIKNLVTRLNQTKFLFNDIESGILNQPEKDWQVQMEDISYNPLYNIEYFLSVFKSKDTGTPRNLDPLGVKTIRSSVLNYEVEYLIAGDKTDQENIKEVRQRIFAIRTVFNLVHIINDPQKMNQINMLTVTLPHPWSAISKTALLTLWGSVEAVLDIKALEAGEGFHLIKNGTEWQLSIENLMAEEWALSIEKNYDGIFDSKIYYQDYLRILLLATSQETLINRSMTLMDENLKMASQNRYGLNDFKTGHLLEIKWRSKTFVFENEY